MMHYNTFILVKSIYSPANLAFVYSKRFVQWHFYVSIFAGGILSRGILSCYFNGGQVCLGMSLDV